MWLFGDKARHDLGRGLVIYKLRWTTCGTLEAVKIQLKHIYNNCIVLCILCILMYVINCILYMCYLSNTAEWNTEVKARWSRSFSFFVFKSRLQLDRHRFPNDWRQKRRQSDKPGKSSPWQRRIRGISGMLWKTRKSPLSLGIIFVLLVWEQLPVFVCLSKQSRNQAAKDWWLCRKCIRWKL